MEGLIYKVMSYQENSKLLFCYTVKGKISLIAKGSMKMNSNQRILSQYLTLINFEENSNSTKKMYTLNNAAIVDDFLTIKDEYYKMKNAALILEIIDTLITDQNDHEKLFNEALKALRGNLEYSHLSFAARMLFYLGYAPNLKGDGKKVLGMSIEKGGIVYFDEGYNLDLDYDSTVLFLNLCSSSSGDLVIDSQKLEKLKYFILKYYQYHLQTTLKTIK